MNLLDFEQNKKVQNFVNIMFGHSMMLITNKSTHITKKTETSVDHIFLNSVTTSKSKTGITKSDSSDHFPILFVADYNIYIKEAKPRYISISISPLSATVSQTLLLQIMHIITLLKFLAYFMANVSKKRKLY